MLDYRSGGKTNNFRWLNIERARSQLFSDRMGIAGKAEIFQASEKQRGIKNSECSARFRACAGYILMGDTNS